MGPPENAKGRSAVGAAGPAEAEFVLRGRDKQTVGSSNDTVGATEPQARKRRPTLELLVKIEPDGAQLRVRGRQAWALELLLHAGQRGLTPLERPGPRWSDYVHKLRRLGFVIETIDEPHGGPFAGTHARYVLRSLVRIEKRVTPDGPR